MSDIETLYDNALAETDGGDDSGLDMDGFTGADIQGSDDDDDFTATDDDDGGEPVDTEDDSDTDGATDEDEDFDWAEYGNRKVEVTVQGQKVKVPLAEALSGYMRQADYTQKTQATAEAVKMATWAQQLRDAFQRDPRGTIGFLQQAYQVDVGPEADPYEDVDPEFRPFAEKLTKIEQENAQLRQAMMQREETVQQERVLNEVKSEMNALQSEFEDFDPFEVLPIARDTGLNLRDAYYLAAAKRDAGGRKTSQEARKQAEAQAEALAAKRALAKKITPARSPRGEAETMEGFDTFEQLLEHNLASRRR